MRRGLTLAELLVTTGLISLIGALLVVIWISSRRMVGRTEGELDIQEQLCEPSIRLAHWLRGAIYKGDSPINYPPEGQTRDRLEFYSCDRLMGGLPEVVPRHPDIYIYRVYSDAQGLWLGGEDETGKSLKPRRVGRQVELEFTNLDGFRVRVAATASAEVRGKTVQRSLTTVVSAPRED